jgi:hypothetical protein
MPENKGLDRGGTLGQEGELSPDGGSAGEPIGKNREGSPRREQQPDKNQPLPGTIRNPDLEEKKNIQPKHEVD